MSERVTAASSWTSLDMDADEAARLVRPHLPDGVQGPWAPVGEGDFCFAYRTTSTGSTGSWIVRAAKHTGAAAALRREVRVLGLVADGLPLEVPRPTLHEPPGCPPFTVHREVVGAVLTRAVWEGLSPPARARAGERLGDFLWALHGSARRVSACDLPQLDETALADRLRREAPAALSGFLAPAVLRGLHAALANRSGHRADPAALLHCDIAPGHILYDEATGALTGVIDFGDVALGPPARDFIFLYEDFGPALCEEVLAAYAASAGAEAPTFAEVRSWYLLEAVSWTLERLALGARQAAAHGLAEIERELAS